MNDAAQDKPASTASRRRRWLLALDPVFEGGRKGKCAQSWDVEEELIAVALLGDVTIDLSNTKSAPTEVHVEAYAIFRDVDVLVGAGTHVELGGGVLRGDLSNEVPPVPEDRRTRTVSITGHSFVGDVTVRVAGG
jgi:hypothetical protein